MQALELTVQRRSEDGWPVVAEWRAPGAYAVRTEGKLRLDLDLLDRAQANPRRYGSTLGEGLFGDANVRAVFERAKENAEGPLHVLLVVEDPELKTRRWERLCVPEGESWNFLVLDQRTPLSIYVPSSVAGAFPPMGRADLRALVVAASPAGLERFRLDPFDVAEVEALVQKGLGDIPSDLLAPPTLDALAEAITGGRYSLLHVVAHGTYGRDGETVLFLATSDGQTDPVPAQMLLDRLRGVGGKGGVPRLVFLATCQSAAPAAEGALGGLAQRLVRDLGIPAVVAMTDRVLLETAQALTSTFYRHLWEDRMVDLALAEAYAGLDPRKHSIAVPTLFSRLGGLPLFGEDLDRPLRPEEVERGLARLGELLSIRAPVLVEAFEQHAAIVRGTLGTEDQALSDAGREERAGALAQIEKVCSEATELEFHALALGRDPPPYDSRQPFRGLYPFRTEDHEFFFGREALVERLRERLVDERFLAVLGPSGCGKSSVVMAGLIPRIQADDARLRVASMTPGRSPTEQLEVALAGEGPSLLVIDQFEELFTLTPSDQRAPFVERVLGAAGHSRVVLTMRADFWGECAFHPSLRDAMQRGQELIAPMDPAELRRAIELQAAHVGLRFDGDLVNTILDDVEGEPGAMPLLQHALLELWNRRHGRWLPAQEYRAIGGVRRAIATTADQVYQSLSDEDRARVREIFLRMTRVDVPGTAGEGFRATRQRVAIEDLARDEADVSVVRAITKVLADARLVVTGRDAATGRDEVEVAHEALIKHWPRLQAWLSEDGEFLVWRQRLSVAVEDWESSRDEGVLLRGAPLAAAERWLAERPEGLGATARAYLEASQGLRRRERARDDAMRHRNLAETGWGVIFTRDADPTIREALGPLLEHRRTQVWGDRGAGGAAPTASAAERSTWYREFVGEDGYHPGESKLQFLRRHGAGATGRSEPWRMPYYLLIVGDPQEIPFEFQAALDVQYAVGRIHFETPEEYANYARSVVTAETRDRPLPKRVVFFGAAHQDDQATNLAVGDLVLPLATQFVTERPEWAIEQYVFQDATKARLGQLMSEPEPPALLFTASHGMAFPQGNPRQRPEQGAVLCSDWPGPKAWPKAIPPEFVFSGADLEAAASLLGLVVFSFASYSAGTPEFEATAGPGAARTRLSPGSFVARLPQRLLGHPRGGALAFVGQVERGWTASFLDVDMGVGAHKNVATFANAFKSLFDGHPVGSAMEFFNQRYGEIASALVAELQTTGAEEEPDRLRLWTAANDARDWVIIGDPAVHLMVQD